MPTHAAPAPLLKPDGNIKVAVERVIHDALRDTIQQINDAYGIRLTGLRVEWFDLSSVGRPEFSVALLHLETTSGSRWGAK